MKVVILAGGLGSRISEESVVRPKPMVEIGGRPILWHIMKYYSEFGFNEFVIAAGYKQHCIKEYFADYFLHSSDITFDYTSGQKEVTVHSTSCEPWRVTVADTGFSTNTAGRVRRIHKYVGDEPFMLTYGDGVSNIDINAVIAHHKKEGATVTITGVNVAQRFGVLEMDGGKVVEFREKSDSDESAVNGGYMVIEPEIFDEPLGDGEDFSTITLASLAERGKLAAYRHTGFWHPMDTIHDRRKLEAIWESDDCPWRIWE